MVDDLAAAYLYDNFVIFRTTPLRPYRMVPPSSCLVALVECRLGGYDVQKLECASLEKVYVFSNY